MKKTQTITCLLITLCMFFNLSSFVFLPVSQTLTAQELTALHEVLNIVNLDKDDLGFENVDFTDLHIGEKILHYSVTENGIQCTDSISYPISYNGEIIMIATDSGYGKYQVSFHEAEAIEKFEVSSVAFIYDVNTFYLYDGTTYYSVHSYSYEGDTRGCLNDFITDLSSVDVADLSNHVSINFSVSPQMVNNYYSTNSSPVDGYYSCTVDFLFSHGTSCCWSASVAMVANYLDGLNYTCETLYNEFASQYETTNGGVNLTEMCVILNEIAPTNYRSNINAPLSETKIMNSIDNGYPIIVGLKVLENTNNNIGHAGVVDAVHTTANYVRICDPAVGRMYAYMMNEPTSTYNGYYFYERDNKTFVWTTQVVQVYYY